MTNHNQNLNSILSTVSTAILGTTALFLFSANINVNANASENNLESNPQAQTSEEVIATNTTSPQELVSTKVYQHQLNNKNAATVYFHGLPFLTFIDLGRTTTQNGQVNNSLSKAQNLSLRLDNLYLTQADGQKINVYWNQKTRSFSIVFDKEELVNIDGSAILPDTTNNLEKDALQATNRLRRLLGNGVPVTGVIGKPSRIAKVVNQQKSINFNQPKLVNFNQNIATNTTIRTGRSYRGIASWYGPGFHGRRTASGERFNQNALTAAHKTLPFGTIVQVTNMNNGRSVNVRINDRGPYSGGRIIDLSRGAANVLGLVNTGTAAVRLQILQ